MRTTTAKEDSHRFSDHKIGPIISIPEAYVESLGYFLRPFTDGHWLLDFLTKDGRLYTFYQVTDVIDNEIYITSESGNEDAVLLFDEIDEIAISPGLSFLKK